MPPKNWLKSVKRIIILPGWGVLLLSKKRRSENKSEKATSEDEYHRGKKRSKERGSLLGGKTNKKAGGESLPYQLRIKKRNRDANRRGGSETANYFGWAEGLGPDRRHVQSENHDRSTTAGPPGDRTSDRELQDPKKKKGKKLRGKKYQGREDASGMTSDD